MSFGLGLPEKTAASGRIPYLNDYSAPNHIHTPSRFPFLFLVPAAAGGILFSTFFSPPPLALFMGAAVMIAAAWIYYGKKRGKTAFFFILLGVFFIGSGLYSRHTRLYDSNSLRRLECSEYADFFGRLYRTPSRGRTGDRLYLDVSKVQCEGRIFSAEGNLLVTVRRAEGNRKKIFTLIRGDYIKISARLLPRKSYANFSVSPYQNYLKTRHIHNRAVCKSILLLEKQREADLRNPINRISRAKQNILKKIDHYFPAEQSSRHGHEGPLLEALLLGERNRIHPDVSQALLNSGLFHLLAISGAHIAILSFFVFLLFRLIRVPKRLSFFLLGLILVFYLLLVEGRPSVLRAVLMALLFIIGKLIWRDVNLLNTVSLSALILLLCNPFLLQDAGFQLTYAATFSIILFYPALLNKMPKLPLRLSEIFAVTLTAQIGVLPIMVCSFNRVALASLVLNFFALPLVGLIMGLGFIFVFFSFILPFLGQISAAAVHHSIGIFMKAVSLFDAAAFLSYRLPSPPFWVVLGYIVFLLLLKAPKKCKGQFPVTVFFFSAFLLIMLTYPFSPSQPHFRVTFIDVGQGDSILIEFPGGKTMLVDGGGTPEDTFDIGEYVVCPFLWKKGLKKVDTVVLTHAHPDHMNGLKAVAGNFDIGEVWESCSPEDNPAYQKFREAVARKTTLKRLFRGENLTVGGVSIQVLHPPPCPNPVFQAHNNQSMVLKLTYGRLSVLLTGDIEKEAELSISSSGLETKSFILKVPHHGSRSSSSLMFIGNTNPSIGVISVGAGNRYLLPHEQIIRRYRSFGIALYRTDRHGAVEISSDGKMATLRTGCEPRRKKTFFLKSASPVTPAALSDKKPFSSEGVILNGNTGRKSERRAPFRPRNQE